MKIVEREVHYGRMQLIVNGEFMGDNGDKNSAEKRNEIYSGEIFNKIRVYELLVYGDIRNIL
jgi:hypothetical protein